jgi:GntR family transcriptional regulator
VLAVSDSREPIVFEDQVDETAAEPLHHQLQSIFMARIDDGTWPAGHQLDGEVSLAERYGVSRATMRQAILALVGKGYLKRKQGRGTFVADRIHNFTIAPHLSVSEHARHELLSIDVATQNAEASEQLGVPASTVLTQIDRVRYEGDEPIGLERTFQPTSTCPGIEHADLSRTLTVILHEDYGLDVVRHSSTVEPVLLDSLQRQKLKFTGEPALGLLITRTAYALDGQALVLGQVTLRGDRCRALFTG